MFKTLRSKFLLGLAGLVISLTPEAAWSNEEICKTAFESNSNKPGDLANFKQIIQKKSRLHKIECGKKNLFEVVYNSTKNFNAISDVRNSRYDNLLLLLKNGYKINHPNAKGYAPLHLAAQKGDINVIYLLIEQGAKINVKNEDKNTPLHLASRYGNQESVNLLLYLGADRDKKNKDKKTPLDIAITEAYSAEKSEVLLQHGAQPSDKILKQFRLKFHRNNQLALVVKKYQKLRIQALSRGIDKDRLLFDPPPAPAPQLLPGKQDPPIYIALSRNDVNTIKLLLSQGADANALSRLGDAPLNLATINGCEEIVKLLIKAGANVNLQNSTGNHPLMMALNNPNIIKLLLENGALADQKTPGYRRTALIYSKNVQVSKLLLDAGADIDYKSGYGDTALSHAAENEYLPLVKFLLEQGADASSTYNGGRKLFLDIAASNKLKVAKLFLNYVTQDEINEAYDHAVLASNLELEDLLKQAGANYLDKEKLFDRAVETKRIEVVKRLLNEGMDTYLKTDKSYDILKNSFPYYAAFDSGYELTKLLLENGASVNLTSLNLDKQDVTPLIYAVGIYNKTSDLISILLKYGANVNDRNNVGETALYKAIAKPFVPGYGEWKKKGYEPEYQRYTDDSLKTIKLLLDYGAYRNIETKNGSIEDLISEMKQSDRQFIVDFANKVDLLLDCYP